MIGPGLEACREMQDLLSGAGELARSGSLTQYVGKLSVVLGAGYGGPHHRRQNASAHRMTSAAVAMMIPSAAFAKSRRVGRRASWPMTNCRSVSIAAKSDRGLIGLVQCQGVFIWHDTRYGRTRLPRGKA